MRDVRRPKSRVLLDVLNDVLRALALTGSRVQQALAGSAKVKEEADDSD